MRRFFVPRLTAGEVELDGAQSRHARRVLRLDVGDRVVLFDGSGREADGTLASLGRRVVVMARPPRAGGRDPAVVLTLAGAIPKGRRAAFMIEKLAELGVARFIPVAFDRGVRLGNLSRLRRIAVEASKQCGRSTVLEIAEPRALNRLDPPLYVASPLAVDPPPKASCTIVIGPEGGLTPEEESRLDARPVRLASPVLRVETAAIAAAALVLSP